VWSRIALLEVVWLFFSTAAATQVETGSIKGCESGVPFQNLSRYFT